VINKWQLRARTLKAETYALYLAYRHPGTPWYAKGFVALVVAYAFSPIDLIPDFIPVLGYLDDLVLIPLGIALALKMIPRVVMDECRAKAQIKIGEVKPVNWLMAIVIVAIWIGLAAMCIFWLMKFLK
jgi:uncharacterized membrane protein YkvA (DUF1232 family)